MAGVITPAQYVGGGGGGAVSSVFGRSGAVAAAIGDYTVAQVTGAAPIASPTFTGIPAAPTATALTSSTQVATTAYADSAVAVETTRAEAAEATKVPLSSLPLSIANGGTGQAAASAAFAALAPLTTAGDLIYENATPTPARLPIGAVNTHLGSNGSVPAWNIGLELQASTGAGGYALVNGTGTIISWTTPNDGLLHRVTVFTILYVSVTEVGGSINLGYTVPSGQGSSTSITGGTSSGPSPHALSPFSLIVEANTAVTITQASALTSGAAVFWAEIWGS
jgi:hypothetical protein